MENRLHLHHNLIFFQSFFKEKRFIFDELEGDTDAQKTVETEGQGDGETIEEQIDEEVKVIQDHAKETEDDMEKGKEGATSDKEKEVIERAENAHKMLGNETNVKVRSILKTIGTLGIMRSSYSAEKIKEMAEKREELENAKKSITIKRDKINSDIKDEATYMKERKKYISKHGSLLGKLWYATGYEMSKNAWNGMFNVPKKIGNSLSAFRENLNVLGWVDTALINHKQNLAKKGVDKYMAGEKVEVSRLQRLIIAKELQIQNAGVTEEDTGALEDEIKELKVSIETKQKEIAEYDDLREYTDKKRRKEGETINKEREVGVVDTLAENLSGQQRGALKTYLSQPGKEDSKEMKFCQEEGNFKLIATYMKFIKENYEGHPLNFKNIKNFFKVMRNLKIQVGSGDVMSAMKGVQARYLVEKKQKNLTTFLEYASGNEAWKKEMKKSEPKKEKVVGKKEKEGKEEGDDVEAGEDTEKSKEDSSVSIKKLGDVLTAEMALDLNTFLSKEGAFEYTQLLSGNIDVFKSAIKTLKTLKSGRFSLSVLFSTDSTTKEFFKIMKRMLSSKSNISGTLSTQYQSWADSIDTQPVIFGDFLQYLADQIPEVTSKKKA